jgi:hypothetical protein
MSTSATDMYDKAPVEISHSAEVERLAAGYTRFQRMLEISGVTLWFGLTVTTVTYIVLQAMETSLSAPAMALTVFSACVAALLFADFSSGLVHWAADNWGNENWPVLGSAFIRPFRLHHLDAKDITRHTYLELNGNNCIVSLPTFWLANQALSGSVAGLFGAVFWVSVAWWVMGTNQFHAWAHTDEPSKFVKMLQRSRLILSTPHHNMHHASPHNRNYCITNGWFNNPLRAMKFFEAIEWGMTKVTGIRANHHSLPRNIDAS